MHEAITTTTVIKHCTYIFAGLTGAITYIGINPKAIYILAILMVIDVTTGITKAIVVHGKRSYRTMKLTAGVIAKLMILLIPLVLALTGHGVGVNLLFLVSASITILIFSETSSILGNIHAISKKRDTDEFDAVALIVAIFRGVVERYLESIKNIKK
jgi:phage-related holin